jgi:hypothetical protein
MSRVRVTIDVFRIDNWIYWTLKQLIATLHISLSHTDYCPQSRSLAAASNSERLCGTPACISVGVGISTSTETLNFL